jgi:hypothetical protein
LGQNNWIKTAARCVLLATRIIACAEQHRVCYRAYQSLKDAIKGTYPIIHPQRNPSGLTLTCYRIREIASCTFQLLFEIFKLSMSYMDTADAFSFTAETIHAIEELVDNKKELLLELKKNRNLINTILSSFPGKCTIEMLIDGVTAASDGVEWVSATASESQLMRGLKMVCNSFFVALELPRLFSLYPTNFSALSKQSRFPSDETITFPS